MSKDKRKRVTSAWPHILALLQDGYHSHAQAVVEYEEHQIDELRKELASLKADNDILRVINAQQMDIITSKGLDIPSKE